jgi:hypothetical protein
MATNRYLLRKVLGRPLVLNHYLTVHRKGTQTKKYEYI